MILTGLGSQLFDTDRTQLNDTDRAQLDDTDRTQLNDTDRTQLNDTDRTQLKQSKRSLSQRHIFHHKSLTEYPGIETMPRLLQAGDKPPEPLSS
jgi:hypothetical protein